MPSVPRTVACGVSFLLMVVGLVIAAPAQAAPAASLTTSRSTVMPGEKFSVTVSTGTRIRRPVVVKHRDGTRWRTFRATTDSRGNARLTVATARRAEFRASIPGTKVRGKKYRALSTRRVIVRTVAPVATASVHLASERVRVVGQVSPSRAGRRLSLQRRDGSTWRTIVPGRPGNAAGRVDFGTVGTQRDLGGRAFRVVADAWKGAPRVVGAGRVVPTLPAPPTTAPDPEPEHPLEEPTAEPTTEPTSEPTTEPTTEPTSEPTAPPEPRISRVDVEVPGPRGPEACRDIITTKTDYVRGHLTVERPDGNRTTVDARLRVRGNSTAAVTTKRPYKIKLDSKTALLGSRANTSKDWVVLANHYDRSLLRNDVAMENARLLGVDWAPRLDAAELRINGALCGAYQIGEGIDAERGRVELGDGDTLLEADTNDDTDPEFRTDRGLRVFLKAGDTDDLGERVEPVSTAFQEVEDLLYAEEFPNNGYRERIDVDSFVTSYLLHEFNKNNDSAFRNSVYMVMRADGTLAMGPPWDYDAAYGRFAWYLFGIESPQGWYLGQSFRDQILADQPTWLSSWPTQLWEQPQGHYYLRLLSDPWFAQKVRDRWHEVVDGLRTLPAYLDERAAALEPAATANFTPVEEAGAGHVVWATAEELLISWNVFHNPPGVDPRTGWRREVAAMRAWIVERTAWMSEQYASSGA